MSKQALKCYVGVGYGNGSQTIITQIDNIGNIVGLDVEPQDIKEIPRDFINENFVEYLTKRNQNIPEELYAEFTV